MNQIPGTPRYTLAMYYMMKSPLEDHPLLYKFVNGDDAYRNSRFKLIPHVSEVRRALIYYSNSLILFKFFFEVSFGILDWHTQSVSSGIMDSETKCWKEGLLIGSHSWSSLFQREKLYGGTLFSSFCLFIRYCKCFYSMPLDFNIYSDYMCMEVFSFNIVKTEK